MGAGKQEGGRYFLDPFGCAKNQVDAETMMAVLDRSAWFRVEDSAAADLIIINSCGFIESAKQESINAVLSYRKRYPGKKILLAGCLAQRYGQELSASLVEADGFFGNADLGGIAAAANGILKKPGPLGEAPFPVSSSLLAARPLLSLPGQAYVKISEGCDNRCAFCAIPLIRGPLHSRPVPEVLEECRSLLDRGVRELCLVGQDLGSYGADLNGTDLLALLEALSTLDGHFWARLLYIHPDHFPRPILDICRRDNRFLPYFDLPFQHGSAGILHAMGRRGDPERYLRLIAEIRSALPDAAIRSTFLTGFPGETDEDFRQLLDFQSQAELDWLGVFVYSREENTPAYSMKGRVPGKIAARRKAIIEERQIGISEQRMDRFVGRSMEALVEEALDIDLRSTDRSPEGRERFYLGRLYCQAPEVDGSVILRSGKPLAAGTFAQGQIAARTGFDLEMRMP
ncbi:MAG: 30S ribosomal protein S12 methylthiotransferase RimO [Treponema sp.]|jgi:ribosomal protein S12 methylthiotransferase|nr:30S ribosomal protein S12 methylthiotransferase RimO [Treponema sp.]